jgi:translation initiation factor 3 subunit C
MSRFFRQADDESSSSSSSGSSSEDEAPAAPARTTVSAGPAGRSRFVASDDSDSGDEKRESRSAVDRRFDALVETSNAIKSHVKNNDWASLRDDFDTLNKQLEKVRKTDMVSGRPPPIPDIYLRCVVTLEDCLKATLEEKPRMSQTNSKALNRMKLTMPKTAAPYRKELDTLRATGKATLYDIVEAAEGGPSSSSSSSSSSSDSEADADADAAGGTAAAVAARRAAKAESAAARAAGGGDGSDSDSWPSSSDDSDSSSDDDGEGGGARASRWLKKVDGEAAIKKKKARKTGAEKGAGAADDETDDDNDGFVTVSRKGAARPVIRPEDMTEESVEAKLLEVLQARGRKGTNRRDQIDIMAQLVAAAKTPKQEVEITMHLISAQFDSIPTAKLFMPADLWREALANATKVVALAQEHFPDIRFADEADALTDEPLVLVRDAEGHGEIFDPTGVAITPVQDALAIAAAKADAEAARLAAVDSDGQIIVRGDLATTFERFDDELYRAWQNTDAYSLEYVDRLKDEVGLLNLASATQAYFEKAIEAEEAKAEEATDEGGPFDEKRLGGQRKRAARVAARRVLHMYHKSTELNEKVRALSGAAAHDKTLAELATLVYRYGEDYAKSQTMLAHIFNHAVDNRFYDARDMLLMSHLQETINGMDVPLQVMFNRAMAQLGLCAFRLGMPWESHACLQEMCSPSFGGGGGGPARLKELLAQGLVQQRGYEKTPEQEKAEMRRQIPYHMHVNLDFVETAHLTSAMLLEVPSMALSKARGDVRRWPISKSFQYFLRSSMKQAFPGPPENTRDFVMAATRCMMKGEWRSAFEKISSIRSWKSLTAAERASTLGRLQELMKVGALRTFSLSYSSYFESMAVEQLAAVYELPPSNVHSVLSKMIINGELRASWDQPTASMVMRRTEPSRLQSLALQLSAKVTNMTDNNEKLLDARTGGSGDRDGGKDKGEWKQGGGRGGRGRGGRGRGGGGRGGGSGRGGGGGFYGGGADRDRADAGFTASRSRPGTVGGY